MTSDRSPKPQTPTAARIALGVALLVAPLRAQEQVASSSEPVANEAEEAEARKKLLERLTVVPGEAIGIPMLRSNEFGAPSEVGPGAEKTGGDFVIAPVPFINPTIGYGLALGSAYLISLDEGSPPSVIGGGVMYSENGSLAGALGFKGYFDSDKYRLTAGVAGTRLNFDYATGGRSVPLQVEALGLALEFLVRTFERVYIGPQVVFSGLDTRIRRESDDGTIPDDELAADNLGLGLRFQRDTRDSTFYPRNGSFADGQFRVFDPALGSNFSFQVLPVAYNHYLSLTDTGVLGLRASGRFAFGDVPFYGESYFGTNSDLRGYVVGDIHDDMLLAAQAEYRQEIVGRFGGVVFGGLGTVTPALDELNSSDVLHSVGFGLRFLLEKTNHINFRIDFAWGKDQSAIYLGVGEAF